MTTTGKSAGTTIPASRPVAVLGSGSWGTALAIQLARHGGAVLLWGINRAQIDTLRSARMNATLLPGIRLPDAVEPTADLKATLQQADDLLVAVPSHAFPEMLHAIKPLLRPAHRLYWATKGLEAGSGRLLHEVAREILGPQIPLGVISGPTFAGEVAKGLPTAITVAATDTQFAEDIAARLHTEMFRAYTSTDMIGVQIGGAVKNVLAIAAGISDGLGYGANARTALITRGLVEIMRLNEVLGGRHDTLMGLAGLGDLVLTCTDNQSRNRRLGMALGRGQALAAALTEIGQVVEGVQTAREVYQLARRRQVDMPITVQVYRVINEGIPPQQAVHALLTREQKAELR